MEVSPVRSSDDRLFASLAHVGGLFGPGPIVAIMILLLKGKESRYIWFQSAQSITFDISLYVLGSVLFTCWFVAGPLFLVGASTGETFFPLGYFAVWFPALVGMVLTEIFRIIAAISTFRGNNWRYPLLADFIERNFPDRVPELSAGDPAA